MIIEVTFKEPEHSPRTKQFKGVAYSVSEEGDVEIYQDETTVAATVKSDVWTSVEKIYEEGDEGKPDVIVAPKDAESQAEFIAEPSPDTHLLVEENGVLGWLK